MLSFKLFHVWLILFGAKIATRRRWKVRRAVPGGLHWAQTNRFDPDTRFARLKVLEVYKERLGDMTDRDARKEGCRNLKAFRKVWKSLHGTWDPDEEVYVVEFEVVQPLYHVAKALVGQPTKELVAA